MKAIGACRQAHILLTAAIFLVFTATAWTKGPVAEQSQWVHLNRSGKLVYKHMKRGERIIDFSYAGYMSGGIALPQFPVKETIAPSGGDDSDTIQRAIDRVSHLPLIGGIRGAVLLKTGHFKCKSTLKIAASGVVLRGSGSGSDGTVVEMTGDPHLAFSIAGTSTEIPLGAPATVTDAYVPAGSMELYVGDVSGFKVRDRVQIIHPVTPAWVRLMRMDTLVRRGKKETWISKDLKTERTIVAINGNRLQFDVPLADSYDANYLGPNGASVVKIKEMGRITQVGLENFRLVAPVRTGTLNDKHFNGLQVNGTQILIDRCTATGNNVFYIAVGPGEQGPNVVLNCVFHGNGHVQPHQRWSTGLLVDSCRVPEGGIDLMNRGEMGLGHGWTVGWGVAWNNVAKSYVIQTPPGPANWGIGNRGEQLIEKMKTYDPGPELPPLPQGIIESQGTPVVPASLYLEQLRERLGAQALRNIGY